MEWANQETRSVAVRIDRDNEMRTAVLEMARGAQEAAIAEEVISKHQNSWLMLLSGIKNYIENNNPLIDADSLYSDLLTESLDRVDWRQIAEYYLEG